MPRFYETTLSITNLHNLSISTHVNRSRIYEIQSLSTKNLTLFEKGEKEDGEKFEYTYTYKKI